MLSHGVCLRSCQHGHQLTVNFWFILLRKETQASKYNFENLCLLRKGLLYSAVALSLSSYIDFSLHRMGRFADDVSTSLFRRKAGLHDKLLVVLKCTMPSVTPAYGKHPKV